MSDRCLHNTFKAVGGGRLPVSDEYYTPPVIVQPIVDYLKRKYERKFVQYKIPPDKRRLPIVWCPFDTADSEYVHLFEEAGFPVIYSHIWDGRDFFRWEPSCWEICVSNMPFSKKLHVLDRLNSLNRPYAMLCNIESLNYQEVAGYFVEFPVQLMLFDKKVSYNGHTSAFASGYFCRDILNRDVEYVHLEHNNTGKNFTGSRMYRR